MYINKFQRKETKYLLNQDEYDLLISKLNKYLVKDEYYKSNISNIYFDTYNDDLIRMSNDKPIYKEKVRLRSYGKVSLDSKVFLEVKKKYKGIVTKRRISVKLKDFYMYLNSGEMIENSQIMKEIDYLFKYYNLVPKLLLAYDRESYKLINDQNIRITFDTNIRSRKEDLFLEMGSSGNLLFKEKTYLMEIKAMGSYPIYLVNILSKCNIYPISFSKYGSVYKLNKESDRKCLTV